MSLINEDFGSLMPSLFLTLNPEPVNGYGFFLIHSALAVIVALRIFFTYP